MELYATKVSVADKNIRICEHTRWEE